MGGKNPTNPNPKFVGSELQRSRTVRSFLAGSLRFLRREVPIQSTGKGNLSGWIFAFHGVSQDERSSNTCTAQQYDERAFDRLVDWMGKVLSPYLDPRLVERAKAKSEELKEETAHSLRQIPKGDVKDVLNAVLPQKAAQLLDIWGFPREFYSVHDISVARVRQMLRAFRALVVCLQLHKTHILTLIARASKGQRQAVLELVKVDRMFLHDPCTEAVITQAEMLNDHNFLEQLTRAQQYPFKPNLRALHHLYLHLMFMIEHFGVPLPRTRRELLRILDPHAKEYKSLESFERDFQRQREDFWRILADAEAELCLMKNSSKG
jgi:hypothetical protein